jgi:molybdopterin-guanine dinucleotide biosynthesis protein MobB
MNRLPIVAVCGYSGAGKTTVLSAIVPRLVARGLHVTVVKHDAHGLDIDRAGKDSDRLFKAGADVLIRGPDQRVLRQHGDAEAALQTALIELSSRTDVILLEGHKTTPVVPKVWLRGADGAAPPSEVTGIVCDLARTDDRESIVLEVIEERIEAARRATPVYAGILIGGCSTRMGRPKHLLRHAGRTWAACAVEAVAGQVDEVVLLGAGEIAADVPRLERLPDVTDAAGPLRGMLAAMRWAPFANWLFLPCDTPLLDAPAAAWLLAQPRPGTWAVLPRRSADAPAEPLAGWYGFRARPLLEAAAGPSALASHPATAQPVLPAGMARGWDNLNGATDLARLPVGRAESSAA